MLEIALSLIPTLALVFLGVYLSWYGDYLSGHARPPKSSIITMFYGKEERKRGRLIAEAVTSQHGGKLDAFGVEEVRIYPQACELKRQVRLCLMVNRNVSACIEAPGVIFKGAKEIAGLYLERGEAGWNLGIPGSFGEYSGITPSELESLLLAGLSKLMIALKEHEYKSFDSCRRVKAASQEWGGYPPV